MRDGSNCLMITREERYWTGNLHKQGPAMPRSAPPFRADHVGSLLRPPELLQARDDFSAGRISAEELTAIEDDAIREVVRMQEDVGLHSATDGEFRRASWHMDFIYELDGITKEAGHLAVKFFNEQGEIEF